MLPDELKKKTRWICWRYAVKDDKKTKIPMIPGENMTAQTNNPYTWEDYWTASNAQGYDGIGFVFNDDGIVGIDIDHCRDPKTGKLEDRVQKLLNKIETYVEESPSGKGIHIIGTYKGKDHTAHKTDKIEIYFTRRFFTITGKCIQGSGKLASVDKIIDDFRNKQKEKKESAEKIRREKELTENKKKSTSFEGHEDESDEDLLSFIFSWKGGENIKKLYEGEDLYFRDEEGHQVPDRNRGDFRLVYVLNLANNNNLQQTERIFRQSGRMRPKWDEVHFATGETYGERILKTAVKKN